MPQGWEPREWAQFVEFVRTHWVHAYWTRERYGQVHELAEYLTTIGVLGGEEDDEGIIVIADSQEEVDIEVERSPAVQRELFAMFSSAARPVNPGPEVFASSSAAREHFSARAEERRDKSAGGASSRGGAAPRAQDTVADAWTIAGRRRVDSLEKKLAAASFSEAEARRALEMENEVKPINVGRRGELRDSLQVAARKRIDAEKAVKAAKETLRNGFSSSSSSSSSSSPDPALMCDEPDCTYKASSLVRMREHKSHHIRSRSLPSLFSCSICGFAARTKLSLRIHKGTSHGTTSPRK